MRSAESGFEPKEAFADPDLKRRALDVLAAELNRAAFTVSAQWEQDGHLLRGSLDEAHANPYSAVDSLVLNFQLSLDNYERGTLPGVREIEAAARKSLAQPATDLTPIQVLAQRQRAVMENTFQPIRLRKSQRWV